MQSEGWVRADSEVQRSSSHCGRNCVWESRGKQDARSGSAEQRLFCRDALSFGEKSVSIGCGGLDLGFLCFDNPYSPEGFACPAAVPNSEGVETAGRASDGARLSASHGQAEKWEEAGWLLPGLG